MASQPAFERRDWTYNDYLDLDDDNRYEVIEGVLALVPAPNVGHQSVAGNIYTVLRRYIELHVPGSIFFAPLDVKLDDYNVVQPDILFIAENRSHILHDNGVMGAPDMVVEVVSPGSSKRDRVRKLNIYERFGVREYWIVDPGSRSVEVLVLEGERFRLYSSASAKGIIRSAVIEGFEVEISDIIT